MYWKKVFGELLFNDVVKFLDGKKMSMSMLVRLAVAKYIEE